MSVFGWLASEVKQQSSNQLVGGGLVLMFTGSLIALARKLPSEIAAWFGRRITVEVEILNSDPLFDYVTLWLDSHPYSKRSRRLTATTVSRIQQNRDSDTPSPMGNEKDRTIRVMLSPAPGRHIFFYKRRLLSLERSRDNASPSSSGSRDVIIFPKHETYTLRLLGKNQNVIRELIDDVVKFGAKPQDQIKLYHSCFGYWRSTNLITPRKVESVVLPAGMVDGVLKDCRDFISSAAWYRQVGIPWHRGYLLHGLPGTGKTSLVSAIAGELRMDLYLLNISGKGMDDERLASLMADVHDGSMILMEDVDCTFPDRESDSAKGVTLSGLLNCLDGIQSREGCMIFMTTNYHERLDSALTRPGRVDVSLEFGLADDEQIWRLRDRLVPDLSSDEAIVNGRGKTMAEIQQMLLKQNPTKARAVAL